MPTARVTYETPADKAAERRVAADVARVTGLTATPMPPKYPCDFGLTEGKALRALLEVKVRDNTSRTFPTYILSVSKWATLQRMSEFCGVYAYLVVRFTDTTMVARLPDSGLDVQMGGREDRGDWQDVEPVAHIPMNAFVPLDKFKL